MKKLVSLLLAVLMVSVLLAVPAGAENYVRLTWVQGTDGDAPTDVAMVNEALNVISRERLGVEVDIIYMTGDQVNTSVLAGEVYDMYFTCDWHNDFNTRVFEGVFADITDLLPVVTPALYATLDQEVWDLAKVNGRNYAIPVKKDFYPEVFLMFDQELYARLGMEIPDEMNFLDLEPYLEAYKAEYPDLYPFMRSGSAGGLDGIFNYINRDASIGFPYSAAGTENATTIISLFEDEEMLARFRAMHDWYNKGYINPDAAILDDSSIDLKVNFIKTGQGFFGADAIWSARDQYAIQISKISGPYKSGSGVRGSMNAFNVALDPERLELAMKYQELVNTDLEYRNILRYGIEGVHFIDNGDGTVTRTDEGRNNYAPWAFSQGSYSLSSNEASPFIQVDPNSWDKVFAGYEHAILAADMGFAFDPTPVEMEIAQLTVIREKWMAQIVTGTIDPDEGCAAAIAEMEAAGLRDVIAEAQAQLDAHLASL